MKYWSAIVIDLLVAIVEMLLAWSVLYYAFTFNSVYSSGFIVFSVFTSILWISLFTKDLVNMYEHLGAENV